MLNERTRFKTLDLKKKKNTENNLIAAGNEGIVEFRELWLTTNWVRALNGDKSGNVPVRLALWANNSVTRPNLSHSIWVEGSACGLVKSIQLEVTLIVFKRHEAILSQPRWKKLKKIM